MTLFAPVAGVVLTGGSSRRMGTTKALIEVDGVAMAERVARTLHAAGCDPVWFQGQPVDAPDLSVLLGRPVVPDDEPAAGPLTAVATAIRHADTDVVVAACDLRGLDVPTVARVMSAGDRREGAGVPDVVVASVAGRFQLLARWHRSALVQLDAGIASGIRSWSAMFDQLRVELVDVEPGAVRNTNRPTDLA